MPFCAHFSHIFEIYLRSFSCMIQGSSHHADKMCRRKQEIPFVLPLGRNYQAKFILITQTIPRNCYAKIIHELNFNVFVLMLIFPHTWQWILLVYTKQMRVIPPENIQSLISRLSLHHCGNQDVVIKLKQLH